MKKSRTPGRNNDSFSNTPTPALSCCAAFQSNSMRLFHQVMAEAVKKSCQCQLDAFSASCIAHCTSCTLVLMLCSQYFFLFFAFPFLSFLSRAEVAQQPLRLLRFKKGEKKEIPPASSFSASCLLLLVLTLFSLAPPPPLPLSVY